MATKDDLSDVNARDEYESSDQKSIKELVNDLAICLEDFIREWKINRQRERLKDFVVPSPPQMTSEHSIPEGRVVNTPNKRRKM